MQTYAIEPQKDAFRDAPPEAGTNFVPCSEEDAQIWAVFKAVPAGDGLWDWDLVEDFESRAKAEHFVDQQV
jgi:uncharacterized protein YbdZ (MbtH family)